MLLRSYLALALTACSTAGVVSTNGDGGAPAEDAGAAHGDAAIDASFSDAASGNPPSDAANDGRPASAGSDGGSTDDAGDDAGVVGSASVSGTVGSISLTPAYAYSEILSSSLFVIISNDPKTNCTGVKDPDTAALSFQTVGGTGPGTYETGSATKSVIVSLFYGAPCSEELFLGSGSVVVNSSPPLVEGSFSVTFDGGALTGTFTAPPCASGGSLPVCDGG